MDTMRTSAACFAGELALSLFACPQACAVMLLPTGEAKGLRS